MPASPQAASLPVSDASSVPSEVASLKEVVALMTPQCSSYTTRFEAIEHRIVEFCSQQAEMNTKISAMMKAQQAFTVTITNLAEKTSLPLILRGLLLHLRYPHPPVTHGRELLTQPHRLRLAALNLEAIIHRQTQLHVLSYTFCPLCHSSNSINLQHYCKIFVIMFPLAFVHTWFLPACRYTDLKPPFLDW